MGAHILSTQLEGILDDKHAIRLLKKGNLNGLEVLVNRYQVQAIRAAHFITQDRAQAEDIVHTTFIRVYERIDQFDETRPFAPWFMRSVVNAALKSAQHQQRYVSFEEQTSDGSSSFEELLEGYEINPEDAVERAELKEAVRAALQKLPPEQRAVVVMKYFLDLNESQIADEIKIPKGTIRWRLHTARKSLRGFLATLSQ